MSTPQQIYFPKEFLTYFVENRKCRVCKQSVSNLPLSGNYGANPSITIAYKGAYAYFSCGNDLINNYCHYAFYAEWDYTELYNTDHYRIRNETIYLQNEKKLFHIDNIYGIDKTTHLLYSIPIVGNKLDYTNQKQALSYGKLSFDFNNVNQENFITRFETIMTFG